MFQQPIFDGKKKKDQVKKVKSTAFKKEVNDFFETLCPSEQ